MLIHPVIRIIALIVTSGFLAQGSLPVIMVAALMLVAVTAFLGFSVYQKAWFMLRRLRWLFLSLLVIYCWFTPGTYLSFLPLGYATWLPTVEGLNQGVQRVACLVLVVFAVAQLLISTDRQQLLQGIFWLVFPLTIFGLSRDRVAARLMLTLAKLDEEKAIVGNSEGNEPLPILDRVSCALVSTIERSESAPKAAIEVALSSAPPILQWGYILLLICAFFVANWLV